MATLPLHTGALPRGELLGRYRSYEDAQKVVDHLAADHDFEVKTLTIVGNDLRSVEKVRGRLSYPRVAGTGALQGALFGAFIGLLLMLFSPEAPLLNLAMAVLMGMAIWMIVGVVSFAARRGTRGFVSASQLTATTYDVVCDFQVAQQARRLVAGAGVTSLNALNDPTGRPPGMAQHGQAGQGPATPAAVPPPAGSSGGPSASPSHAAGPGQPPNQHQPQGQHHPQGPGQVPASAQPQHRGPAPGVATTHGAAATQQHPGDTPEGVDHADRSRAAQQWQQPDGRPRYGVRLQDAQQSAPTPTQSPAPQSGSEWQHPGSGPEQGTDTTGSEADGASDTQDQDSAQESAQESAEGSAGRRSEQTSTADEENSRA
ncbi:general stress protein [Nesterenkonia sphaerica]|uniref:ECF transporter S component n=1 Tax=Nesterenkonia sphaerica TaxID=1804988 RepID=A0A5R9ALF6_9MICC|nr:general stress protein [Nesterenkonia sphaerica]TLP78865.1 ECF transporter S component [Nesterenkonia sphaerica]